MLCASGLLWLNATSVYLSDDSVYTERDQVELR